MTGNKPDMPGKESFDFILNSKNRPFADSGSQESPTQRTGRRFL